MFGIHTGNMEWIRNYESADKYFNETTKPRTRRWLDHQRPLRDTRSTHLRIEKGHYNGVDCYDLVLYQTPLVRYFKPNEKGERAVWLQNHYTNSSQKFIHAAGWWNRKMLRRDDGKEFQLQLSGQSLMALDLWGDSFTCKLVFNANNEVMMDKSVHIPFTRRVSSSTQRAKRKKFLASLTPIFDMLEMQYQSFISDIVIDDGNGRPFAEKNYAFRFSDRELLLPRLREHGLEKLTPDEVTQLVRCATEQCRYNANYIVDKRANDWRCPAGTTWAERAQMAEVRALPVNGIMLHHHSPEVIEKLTPTWADLRKAIERDLLAFVKMDKGDEYQPLAQLAETYPQVVYSVKVEAWLTIPDVLGIETYRKLTNRKGLVY